MALGGWWKNKLFFVKFRHYSCSHLFSKFINSLIVLSRNVGALAGCHHIFHFHRFPFNSSLFYGTLKKLWILSELSAYIAVRWKQHILLSIGSESFEEYCCSQGISVLLFCWPSEFLSTKKPRNSYDSIGFGVSVSQRHIVWLWWCFEFLKRKWTENRLKIMI